MKKLTFSLLCSLTLIGVTVNSTAQNALNFDGVNDVVVVPNASAEIANTTNFSISCWVYATKSGGPYGIVGFRNNLDADFYILQLTSTSLECRFRNSLGINYDIAYSGLILNQWQHFVFAYDTDTLRLYRDGLPVAKLFASGMITNLTTELRIGNSPWNTSFFWYGGSTDEVGLWDKTLSASEVNCIYNNGINPFSTGLKLYYDFDEGTANGNNAGITTLVDRVAANNGTLTGFTLNGTTSNWVNGVAFPTVVSQSICFGDSVLLGSTYYYTTGTYFNVNPAANGCDSATALHLTATPVVKAMSGSFCQGETYNFRSKILSSAGVYFDTLTNGNPCDTIFKLTLSQRPSFAPNINATICNGETYTFGTSSITSSGVYVDNFNSIYGCDSTVTLTLIVDTVNVAISTNSGTLIANALQADNTFEWYDCNNDIVIPNETDKFFTIPNPQGAYAVIVTHTATGCVDTSECLGRVIGIGEQSFETQLSLIPNPVNGFTQLDLGNAYQNVNVSITNNQGQVVMTKKVSGKRMVEINAAELSSGIYFIRVTADEKSAVVKMLKE